MMGKVITIGAVAVGYVLGARAGRGRYEQIANGAQRLWQNPKVRSTVSHAGDMAKERAPQVKEKAAEAAHKATDAVRSSGDNGGGEPTGDPVTGFQSSNGGSTSGSASKG